MGEIANFGVLCISGHADVADALEQPNLFSSPRMRALSGGQTRMMGAQGEEADETFEVDSLLISDPERRREGLR